MSKFSELASNGTAHFQNASQPKRRWIVFGLGLLIGFILGAFLL